jgi:hypothetical protein
MDQDDERMNQPLPAPSRLLTPSRLMVALTMLGWLLVAVSPKVPEQLGIPTLNFWFLDSYAILAASDAHQAGLNVEVSNPLDVLHRAHSYSDWWFALAQTGLTRKDNFVFGGACVLMFGTFAALLLRPRNYRDAMLGVLVAASPPVLLAICRGNNDLVVFALLAAAALIWRTDAGWRLVLAWVPLAVATGLKFYPVVAAVPFLLLRPARRLLTGTGLAALGLGLVLWSVSGAIGRGTFDLRQDVHKVGSAVLLRDLGFYGHGAQAVAIAVIVLSGVMLAWTRRTTGLGREDIGWRERASFALGAIVLVSCFLAGLSHSYRWIFTLLLLPWLWGAGGRSDRAGVAPGILGLTWVLLLATCWCDGLFCLIVNAFFVPWPQATYPHLLQVWRLSTQWMHWVFIALLAGWLADLVFDALRALRADPARP